MTPTLMGDPFVIPLQPTGQTFFLSLRTKATHKIDDQTDDENQANSATADYGTSQVKSAAAEHQEKNNQN